MDKRTENNLYDCKSDKRTENNLYDCKSWVRIFSSLFGSVVDKRMRVKLFKDQGRVVWGKLSRGRVVGIPNVEQCKCKFVKL